MNIFSVVTAMSFVGLFLIVPSTQNDSISPKHISMKMILYRDQCYIPGKMGKKIYIKVNKTFQG